MNKKIVFGVLGVIIILGAGHLLGKRMKSASFDKSMLVDSSSDEARLFIKTCSQCHDLPSPASLRPMDWRLVIERMQARIQSRNMTEMTEEEKESIISYLAEAKVKAPKS